MTTVEQSIFINAAPEAVMTVAGDVNRMSEWFVSVKSADSDGNWPAVDSVMNIHFKSVRAGVAFTFNFTTLEYVPNEKWVLEVVGEGMFKGVNSWTLTPQDGGSVVDYKMEYELSGSYLEQVMEPTAYSKSVAHSLNKLKELVEG